MKPSLPDIVTMKRQFAAFITRSKFGLVHLVIWSKKDLFSFLFHYPSPTYLNWLKSVCDKKKKFIFFLAQLYKWNSIFVHILQFQIFLICKIFYGDLLITLAWLMLILLNWEHVSQNNTWAAFTHISPHCPLLIIQFHISLSLISLCHFVCNFKCLKIRKTFSDF